MSDPPLTSTDRASCHVDDIDNQGAARFAREADPDGQRTIGTHGDLPIRSDNHNAIKYRRAHEARYHSAR